MIAPKKQRAKAKVDSKTAVIKELPITKNAVGRVVSAPLKEQRKKTHVKGTGGYKNATRI